MCEPPDRDRQPTAWIGSLLPGFPPHKPRGLRFSRRAAIGCCHGRQPMEWSVLIALKRQRGDMSRPAWNSCRHMFEMAIRIVVIADWRHACRCFATPTSPLNRSSDWRPRLLHGIASQFSRNRAIFRLGMEVATLRLRDDVDTPSTSTSTSTKKAEARASGLSRSAAHVSPSPPWGEGLGMRGPKTRQTNQRRENASPPRHPSLSKFTLNSSSRWAYAAPLAFGGGGVSAGTFRNTGWGRTESERRASEPFVSNIAHFSCLNAHTASAGDFAPVCLWKAA